MLCVQEVVAKRQPARKLPVFVGGQSMGGMTAILAGITRPDLYKVLRAAPSLRMVSMQRFRGGGLASATSGQHDFGLVTMCLLTRMSSSTHEAR